MLRMIWWLMFPVSALGHLSDRIRGWAHRKWHLANAWKPGTKVATLCACHPGKEWFVEGYDYDADDYKIVATWPPPSPFGRTVDVDVMYIRRDKLKEVA